MREDHWTEARQATCNSYRIDGLEQSAHPALRSLRDAVVGEVARYGAELGAILPWIPAKTAIDLIAVIGGGEGFTDHHIHPRAWLTCVFYATAPALSRLEGDAGRLRIGRPRHLRGNAPGWPDMAIDPIAGRLVILPGYFTHWSVPPRCLDSRIAMVLDIVDRSWCDDAIE